MTLAQGWSDAGTAWNIFPGEASPGPWVMRFGVTQERGGQQSWDIPVLALSHSTGGISPTPARSGDTHKELPKAWDALGVRREPVVDTALQAWNMELLRLEKTFQLIKSSQQHHHGHSHPPGPHPGSQTLPGLVAPPVSSRDLQPVPQKDFPVIPPKAPTCSQC